jgi:retron-type reverse transcriptase
MDELKAPGKPFEISKRAVWEAWEKVKANKGAPGVDGTSIAEFEKDLKGNLYKIWNRMSSGTYFPPPVRAVSIPKKGGVRILGVPSVGDRVAQTVVAGVIEERAEPVFHPDSYGYRPKRSALDAVAACRERCWRKDWVVDLDIRAFFDSVPWDLVVKAVRAVCDVPWVVLYPRWRCPTGRSSSVTGGPLRVLRYRLCLPICSCTSRSICSWPGSSRPCSSSGTPTTRWCIA